MKSPLLGFRIGEVRTPVIRGPGQRPANQLCKERSGFVSPAALAGVCCPLVDILGITQACFQLCFSTFACSLWVLQVHLQLGDIKTVLSQTVEVSGTWRRQFISLETGRQGEAMM